MGNWRDGTGGIGESGKRSAGGFEIENSEKGVRRKNKSPFLRFAPSPVHSFLEEKMADKIETYRDLKVYQNAFEAVMRIYELTKKFPQEEKYSMVDQMRRFSRSVCANLAEAWRKRRYRRAFVAKLSDSETEACETQVWLDFAIASKYLDPKIATDLHNAYDQIMGQIVKMIQETDKWLIRRKDEPEKRRTGETGILRNDL